MRPRDRDADPDAGGLRPGPGFEILGLVLGVTSSFLLLSRLAGQLRPELRPANLVWWAEHHQICGVALLGCHGGPRGYAPDGIRVLARRPPRLLPSLGTNGVYATLERDEGGEPGRENGMLTVTRYRFATTFRRRWGGYLAIAVLVGLVGGIAMGSIAAARRTQSSYPAFLASTNASDLTMSTYGVTPDSPANGYSPALTRQIAQLPEVKLVENWVGVGMVPLRRDGSPDLNSPINTAGSLDGLYFNEDRATPVVGRMADPRRADQFVTTALGRVTWACTWARWFPWARTRQASSACRASARRGCPRSARST